MDKIEDIYGDIDKVHEDWDNGLIKDNVAIEKFKDICQAFLNENREIAMEVDMDKEFEITSILRADLKDYFTMEEIKNLDDDDMTLIASKMADMYLDNGFWTDMDIVVKDILEKKK